ncbi:MAG: S-methyl-5-thioribose-1-phosphate isomerase [Bacteriovoracaceae bacterium]|nr:S-methyl-5-thioribose-1-phosphate isomerase [Bacteroidota bacterium]
MINSIEWNGSSVRFLDQTQLPDAEVYTETNDLDVLIDAINRLKVRGAPLLGITAAYGVLLGTHSAIDASAETFKNRVESAAASIAATRPTAVNLFWSLERMRKILRLNSSDTPKMLFEKLKAEAVAIHTEDRTMCEAMGKAGAELIPNGASILTHCNTGALATGGIGTAFGVLFSAHHSGKKIHVYADETRPLLQGARLTMWELQKEGIPATLITDNAAAWTMKSKKIDLVITGADRIAVNGDTANKIGTYNLAVLAKEHNIPFYIVAPSSTIDPAIPSGDQMIIEERSADEVINGFGKRTAPVDSDVFSPAFDVTPNTLISGIITETGVHTAPYHRLVSR